MALVATLQMSAAPVDVSAAKTKAEQYLANKVYAGKIMAPGATQATLIKAEVGDIAKVPLYYIFNTASTFVIVSGDDR
ncbi:MAG: Spi family protease inhibitor, partial [Muribaculaceae bacterium]|nr:Spi family protease inhibitor [Muribaculaceae bacterium]